MKRTHFSYQIVEFIPEQLDEGVLYVSRRFGTAVHKCACECGEEVVTPIGPVDWSIEIANGAATLDPSVGNWSFACRSHYFIRTGKVVWCSQMSYKQIEQGRAFDRRLRERCIAETNRMKRSRSYFSIGWTALKRWWMS